MVKVTLGHPQEEGKSEILSLLCPLGSGLRRRIRYPLVRFKRDAFVFLPNRLARVASESMILSRDLFLRSQDVQNLSVEDKHDAYQLDRKLLFL